MSAQRTKALVALLGVSAIWGIAAVVIKYTLQFIPPISFLYVRFLIASLILYYFAREELKELLHSQKLHIIKVLKAVFFKSNDKNTYKYIEEEIKNWDNLKSLFLLGTLGSSINLSLVFYAYKYTSSIEGTIIYSSAPIWIFIGGAWFLKEKVTKRELTGFLITLIGFSFIIFEPLLNGKVSFQTNLIGNFLMLLAAISWATYAIMSKNVFNHSQKYSPVLITFITFFAGAVTLAPFSIYEILNTNIDYLQALPGILYMVLLSTIAAYWLYEYGVQKIEVSETGIFQYLQPIFTIPFAIIFLDEAFTWIFIVGGTIAIIGIYLAESRRK